jgi:hypothetical protein
VIEWLLFYKVPFIRVNYDDINNQPTLNLSLGQEEIIQLEYKGKSIAISSSSIMWFRRGALKKISTDFFSTFNLPFELKNQLHKHYYQEQQTLYEFIYQKIALQGIVTRLHYVPNKLEILEKANTVLL